jgi:hypothetical protein
MKKLRKIKILIGIVLVSILSILIYKSFFAISKPKITSLYTIPSDGSARYCVDVVDKHGIDSVIFTIGPVEVRLSGGKLKRAPFCVGTSIIPDEGKWNVNVINVKGKNTQQSAPIK